MTIYKGHELSRSLNGTNIIYIARNNSGNVVFREKSEDKLKNAINKSIEDIKRRQEELEKKKADKENAKQKRGLFAPPPEPVEELITPEEVAIPTQKRVTRGPDGKFISKSTITDEGDKEKTFWDKLTS